MASLIVAVHWLLHMKKNMFLLKMAGSLIQYLQIKLSNVIQKTPYNW